MSEDESIRRVFLPSFLGMSSSKRPIPDPILDVKLARCSIGEVRSAVQVVQNWIAGIPIQSRGSRLG